DRVDERQRSVLLDEQATVFVRTLRHPAAEDLAALRPVHTCDDLYDTLPDFEAVYHAITARILEAATSGGAVVYAVPGSAVVGERTVTAIRAAASERAIDFRIEPGLSFLDLAYVAVGVDPIADGVQVLDAHAMPDPLPLHLPTIITQVDTPMRAADTAVALGRLLDGDHLVTVLDRLGDSDAAVVRVSVSELGRYPVSERTSVFVDAVAVGVLGLVTVNRILRAECPWDRKQTHHTLLTHLLEEAYETADALGELSAEAPGGAVDFGVYAEVEEELGDLLLQVVFHATLASEAGAFDIDEVAESIRRKLVARHPHVFADIEVDGADEVLANWERIKQDEKGRNSLMDDIPTSMPAIGRAMKVQKRASSVGFDFADTAGAIGDLRDEIDELVGSDTPDDELHEIGDVLFSAVNVARHLSVDPELALRRSVDRFASRFRAIEVDLASQGLEVADADDDTLDAAWRRAKA
ncbi:MAG: nucleoside triphosphate pyrophosphohydrolase, partial [Acidimicrobiia bacterium]|nr:nucleoside triphosphate pyrophosphohydrolase [Acidimicrobiia bacterium]